MSEVTRIFHLTIDEALMLDGRARPEVQGEVDIIKRQVAIHKLFGGLTERQRNAAAEVVTTAEDTGSLRFRRDSGLRCRTCDKTAGYHTYRRSCRGGRKGEPNYDKPRTFGVTLVAADTFVVMRGDGWCDDCWSAIRPPLTAALADVRAELPVQVCSDGQKWKRWHNVKCPECDWSGHEGQLGRVRAIFGGTYPGKCPSCQYEQLPMSGKGFDRTGWFVVAAS